MEMTKETLAQLLEEATSKAVEPLKERIVELEGKATPSPVKVDATVPAEPQGAEEKAIEERIRKALAESSSKLPEKGTFSFVRFFDAQRRNDWSDAPYERQAMEATRKKSLSWASGSSGGYWVGTEFLPQEFTAHFVANIVCRKAGCMVLPCTGAPVEIPTITAGATAYWTGQNATITASDQTPGQVQLTPKFVNARTQISEFLAQTSGGAAEAIVREDLARTLSLEVDNAMLSGTASTATPYVPTGLANISGINTVAIGTNGGALTMAHLRDMEYALQYDNVPMDDVVWIMHPRTWHSICEFEMVQYSGQTSGGGFIFAQQPEKSVARSILGYPVYLSTQVDIDGTKGTGTAAGSALADVFLVNIKDFVLAEWGGIKLRATDVGGNAWAQNAIEIKATYAMDCALRHATSCCLLSDSTS